jgi:hypothetical protein
MTPTTPDYRGAGGLVPRSDELVEELDIRAARDRDLLPLRLAPSQAKLIASTTEDLPYVVRDLRNAISALVRKQ